MTRRTIGLLVTLALSLHVAPLAAEAQQAGKVPRLGVLAPAEPPSPAESPTLPRSARLYATSGTWRDRPWRIEYRYALGRQERFPDLVAELVGLPVDILVVGSSPAAVAAQATQAIPIVFLGGGDPVRSGLIGEPCTAGWKSDRIILCLHRGGLVGSGWSSSRRPFQRARIWRSSVMRAICSA